MGGLVVRKTSSRLFIGVALIVAGYFMRVCGNRPERVRQSALQHDPSAPAPAETPGRERHLRHLGQRDPTGRTRLRLRLAGQSSLRGDGYRRVRDRRCTGTTRTASGCGSRGRQMGCASWWTAEPSSGSATSTRRRCTCLRRGCTHCQQERRNGAVLRGRWYFGLAARPPPRMLGLPASTVFPCGALGVLCILLGTLVVPVVFALAQPPSVWVRNALIACST